MKITPNTPSTEEDNFDVWMPVEIIEKAGDGGKTDRFLQGIASTEDRDFDGEVIVQKGLDISYLKSNGFINWDHGSKPGDLIGEPVNAELTKKGLFVLGKLYDTPTATQAYELAKAMERAGSSRRLGWSIQGAVVERDPSDRTRVRKAVVHQLALSPQPKNSKTFAELVKSFGAPTTTSWVNSERAGYVSAGELQESGMQFIPLLKSEKIGVDGSTEREFHPIAMLTSRPADVVKALEAGYGTDHSAARGGSALIPEDLEGDKSAKPKTRGKKKLKNLTYKSLSRAEAHSIIRQVFPHATKDWCDRFIDTVNNT